MLLFSSSFVRILLVGFVVVYLVVIIKMGRLLMRSSLARVRGRISILSMIISFSVQCRSITIVTLCRQCLFSKVSSLINNLAYFQLVSLNSKILIHYLIGQMYLQYSFDLKLLLLLNIVLWKILIFKNCLTFIYCLICSKLKEQAFLIN